MPFNQVVLINPARTVQKNSHLNGCLDAEEVFFNFGLFSIQQYLHMNNVRSIVVDCQIEKLWDKIDSSNDSISLFCISIISAFNGPDSNKIIDEIKEINKNNLVVIGGQHFIGHLGKSAFDIFPEADIAVSGEGEDAVYRIVEQWKMYGNDLRKWILDELPENCFLKINGGIYQGVMEYRVCDMKNIDFYDYSLYPTTNCLFPSIEYSRGCPFHCTFCANTRNNKKYFRNRSVISICNSAKKLLEQLGLMRLKFYMQASHFSISNKDIEDFYIALGSIAGKIEWRTEMRVDSYRPGILRKLHEVGLRVVDIGVDSASHNTLNIMKKTNNPSEYLTTASLLIKEAYEVGIICKINMLIHPGDTKETIAETENWLIEHKAIIKAISVSPVLIFPGTELDLNFSHYQDLYGTRKIESSELAHYGVYEVDPSFYLSNTEAKEFSIKMCRFINNKDNYAYIKSFGYHKIVNNTSKIKEKLPDSQVNTTTPFLN